MLGWPDLRASVPGEIIPSHDFYDFDDKYVDGTAGLEVPARLPEGVADEMARLAVAACQALRVDCMARVDFFYEQGGRGPARQRGQHHPGLHADLDVPPAVGGVRRSVPGSWSMSWSTQARRRAGRRARFEAHRL